MVPLIALRTHKHDPLAHYPANFEEDRNGEDVTTKKDEDLVKIVKERKVWHFVDAEIFIDSRHIPVKHIAKLHNRLYVLCTGSQSNRQVQPKNGIPKRGLSNRGRAKKTVLFFR